MELTLDEQHLARTLDFSEVVLRVVKQELLQPLEPFVIATSPNDGEVTVSAAEILDGKGFVVKLADKQSEEVWEQKHEDIVCRMRAQLISPHGYMAFLTEDWTYRPCLGVTKAQDESAILRATGIHGFDFDHKYIDAERMVAILQQWRQLCKFDIIGSDYNNVKLRFQTLPQELPAFCKQVNHLCWELQQIYDIDGNTDESGWIDNASAELAEIIRRDNRLYLWWD